MELKQICREILEEAKKNNVQDLRKFNHIKLQVLNRFSYSRIPKNATIASLASEEDRELFKKILSMKPVRTISGVAPIALMTDPYPCPHTIKGIGPCTYCPGGPGSVFGDVPQSYTGKEPSTRRAIRNLYDPYLGVFNRLEHYVAMNSVPEKCEIILQGGTFPFSPKSYQDYFVKYLLKAMNDFSRLFYNESGIDLDKFNSFFELPTNIDNEERTERLHKKLLLIKNLDFGNKKVIYSSNDLFFNNENNNGLKNELTAQWKKFSEKSPNEQLIRIKNCSNINESNVNGNANLSSMKAVMGKVKAFDNPNISLEQAQKENETAKIRCVGLTIDTKSDYGKLIHGNQMLKLGCTRVEIGIQSIYDEVLEKTNRGNTVQDNIDSIRILKDLGFKINAHYMPGLPYTSIGMDRKGLRELFENPDYRPDMLKIYPCMVMPGTRLYDYYKAGKFKPLATKEAAELIAEMFSYAPEWVRVMRVQRDIPSYAIEAGVDRTNLRQYVGGIMKNKNIVSRDIRAREAGLNSITNKKISLKNLKIKIIEYEASKGKEFFIAAEDEKNDILFGYCRLRLPSGFLREEITNGSALLREIHVYSAAVEIGKQSDESFQHKGIGKKLLFKAEEIAKQNGKSKVVIISGIGAREYFRKSGYELEGPYMAKLI